jgi:hypothetical protein
LGIPGAMAPAWWWWMPPPPEGRGRLVSTACWGGGCAVENRARRAMVALTHYYIVEGITITNCAYPPTLLQAKPQILVSRIGVTFGIVYLLARLIFLDQ